MKQLSVLSVFHQPTCKLAVKLSAHVVRIPLRTSPEYCPSWLRTLARDESAQGSIEYVLLLAMIGLIATAGSVVLGSTVNSPFKHAQSNMGKHLGWFK